MPHTPSTSLVPPSPRAPPHPLSPIDATRRYLRCMAWPWRGIMAWPLSGCSLVRRGNRDQNPGGVELNCSSVGVGSLVSRGPPRGCHQLDDKASERVSWLGASPTGLNGCGLFGAWAIGLGDVGSPSSFLSLFAAPPTPDMFCSVPRLGSDAAPGTCNRKCRRPWAQSSSRAPKQFHRISSTTCPKQSSPGKVGRARLSLLLPPGGIGILCALARFASPIQ